MDISATRSVTDGSNTPLNMDTAPGQSGVITLVLP